MRAQLLALMMSFVATTALGQSTTSSGPSPTTSTAPVTTAGQSLTGSTAGQNQKLTTTIAPAPVLTTPPINPAPGSSPMLLTNTPNKPLPRRRSHSAMGTSNTFQNGINGDVNSNAVVNGTAGPPSVLQIPPTQPPQQSGGSRQPRAQGSVANPNPAGSPNG